MPFKPVGSLDHDPRTCTKRKCLHNTQQCGWGGTKSTKQPPPGAPSFPTNKILISLESFLRAIRELAVRCEEDEHQMMMRRRRRGRMGRGEEDKEEEKEEEDEKEKEEEEKEKEEEEKEQEEDKRRQGEAAGEDARL